MSSAASKAERPLQGAPAECAASPSKVYSTEIKPVPRACPHETLRLLLTWVKIHMSISSKYPSRTNQALEATSSSAIPGQTTRVPGISCSSIICLTPMAAVTFKGIPAL